MLNTCLEISFCYQKYGSIFFDKMRNSPKFNVHGHTFRSKISTVCCVYAASAPSKHQNHVQFTLNTFWTISLNFSSIFDFKCIFENKHPSVSDVHFISLTVTTTIFCVLFCFFLVWMCFYEMFIHYEFVHPKQLIALSYCASKRHIKTI